MPIRCLEACNRTLKTWTVYYVKTVDGAFWGMQILEVWHIKLALYAVVDHFAGITDYHHANTPHNL